MYFQFCVIEQNDGTADRVEGEFCFSLKAD